MGESPGISSISRETETPEFRLACTTKKAHIFYALGTTQTRVHTVPNTIEEEWKTIPSQSSSARIQASKSFHTTTVRHALLCNPDLELIIHIIEKGRFNDLIDRSIQKRKFKYRCDMCISISKVVCPRSPLYLLPRLQFRLAGFPSRLPAQELLRPMGTSYSGLLCPGRSVVRCAPCECCLERPRHYR